MSTSPIRQVWIDGYSYVSMLTSDAVSLFFRCLLKYGQQMIPYHLHGRDVQLFIG